MSVEDDMCISRLAACYIFAIKDTYEPCIYFGFHVDIFHVAYLTALQVKAEY